MEPDEHKKSPPRAGIPADNCPSIHREYRLLDPQNLISSSRNASVLIWSIRPIRHGPMARSISLGIIFLKFERSIFPRNPHSLSIYTLIIPPRYIRSRCLILRGLRSHDPWGYHPIYPSIASSKDVMCSVRDMYWANHLL